MNKSQDNKEIFRSEHFSLVVLALVFIGFFGYFALTYLQNAISGAESASGTVNFTILAGGGEGPGEGKPRLKGRGSILSLELEVTPKNITERLDRYVNKIVELHLLNRGSKTFDLTLFTNVRALTITEPHVLLPPGAEEIVPVVLLADQQGIFTGVLTIEGISAFKQLPVLITVQTTAPYFVQITIPEMFHEILPGTPFYATILLEPLTPGDLTITYLIKDARGVVVLQEQEKKNITDQRLAFQKTFSLPSNLPLGPYFLIIKAENNGERADGADTFALVDALPSQEEFPTQLYRQNPLIFFLIVLAILLLHIVMTWRRRR